MFKSAATAYGQAGSRYRTVDLTTRIEGASSHGLVAILYEELLTALSRLRGPGKRAEVHSRVLAILTALDTGLDHDKGGEVAAMLAEFTARRGGEMRPLRQGERHGDEEA